MFIDIKEETANEKCFGDIIQGMVFKYGEEFFIKTQEIQTDGIRVNALRFADGVWVYFRDNDEITPKYATMTVRDNA